VPELLERVLPVHELVPVEVYLPGCPPPAERIRAALEPLLRGELPQLSGTDQIRFG
jgi:NAD-reducing hydrogenase small subunit